MEITERVELAPIHWLSQLTFAEFVDTCLSNNKIHTQEERKTKYSILQQFCKTNMNTKCITKRIYSHATEAEGRLFSGGSLQGIPGTIRGLLMRNGIGTDIDMNNAHPVILSYICKLHQIPCPQLELYINNRDVCLAAFENRDIGKKTYITSLNKDSINRTKGLSEHFKKFDIEIKKIQKILVSIKDYECCVNAVPANKSYNKIGSATNRILCFYENIILQHAIHFITTKNIEIAILMFDGLMVYGDYYKDQTLLNDITTYVNNQMPRLDMKWSYKEHNDDLHVPKDFTFVENSIVDERTFEYIVKEFEKTHLKIVNKSLYIKHTDSNIAFFTLGQLKTSYSHLSYDEPVYNKKGILTGFNTRPFINKWTGYKHNIRRKDDIDNYPDNKKCPENIFNIWRPFAMELLTTPYTHKQTELDELLYHVKILCNHEENVYDYFVKWIAQMIQYPHVKSIMPTLISAQGSGKGTLFKLLENMLGYEKVFESTKPSRDVWGGFNSIMCNCFLVNLNELSKKETVDSEGEIKALITDNALTINQKGVPQYKIKSYHRFIGTTNPAKDEPLNSSKGDRRNCIVRSSDEKKGDVAYFNKIYSYLDDIEVIRTCFDYFRNIKGMDNFKKIPMPQTEYQNNLKELSKSPIELWLTDFTREHIDEEVIELLGGEIYELFKNWCFLNGFKYEISSLKLGVRLINMNIKGVCKGKHTNKGETKVFTINELNNTFNLGCLIKI